MSSTEDPRRSYALVVTALLSVPRGSAWTWAKRLRKQRIDRARDDLLHGDTRWQVRRQAPRGPCASTGQSGVGTGFRMAGRAMKEWIECAPQHDAGWKALAHEAYQFASTPGDSSRGVPPE